MTGKRLAVLPVLLALAAALALGACGGAPSGGSGGVASPSPSASQSSWRIEEQPAALALARMLVAQKAWRSEPAGDVPAGRAGVSANLVFAHLYRISERGGAPFAVFDAEQLYVGAPAEREAARDGRTIPGATYRRNAYVHRQSLPLAADCPIVYAWANTARVAQWPDVPDSIPVSRTTYWLVVDGGEITAMVWEGY
jgi:hypothetical protein